MINFFSDHIAITLILILISFVQFLGLSSVKCINKVQALFIAIASSPFVIIESACLLIAAVAVTMYKFVLMLGGVDIDEFEAELKSVVDQNKNDKDKGDE